MDVALDVRAERLVLVVDVQEHVGHLLRDQRLHLTIDGLALGLVDGAAAQFQQPVDFLVRARVSRWVAEVC